MENNLVEATRLTASEGTEEEKIDAELEAAFNDADLLEVEEQQAKEARGGKSEGAQFMEDLDAETKELEEAFATIPEGTGTSVGFKIKSLFDVDNNIAGGKAAVKGIGKAVEDLANGVYDLTNAAEDFFAKKGLGDGKWLSDTHKFDWVKTPENTADAIVFQTARYLLPFGPISAGIRATAKGLGLVGKSVAASEIIGTGAYTGLTMDPDDKRLSDYLEAVPEIAPLIPDIMLSKEDDTKLESRIKNTVESIATGFAAEGLVKWIGKTYKNKKAVVSSREEAVKIKTETEQMVAEMEELSKKAGLSESDEAATKMLGELSAAKEAETLAAQQAAKIEITPEQAIEVEKSAKYFEKPEVSMLQLAEATQAKKPDELIQALDLMDDSVFKKLHDDFKGGVVSLEDASAAAKKILADSKATNKLLNRNPRTPITGEEFVALSMLHENAANELIAAIPNTLEFTTLSQKVAFDESLAKFRMLSEKMLGGSSEAGRLMRYKQEVWGAQKGAANKLKYLEEATRLADGNRGDIARYIKMSKDAGSTIPELSQGLLKSRTHKMGDVFYSMFVNGALYNMTTFAVNALSHVVTAGFHIGETTLGALIPGSGMYMREVPAIAHGWAASLADAFSAGKNAFFSGTPPAGFGSKFEIRPSAFNEFDGLLGGVIKAAGPLIELPTKAMTEVDVFSKVVQQRARMHQLAMRQIVAGGAKGAQAKRMYKNMIANPPEGLELASTRFAKTQTFTDSNYDNLLMGGVGEGVAKIAKAIPMGRVFVPFTQTAANIASYTAQRTPFALLSPKVRAAWNAAGASRGEMLSRIGLGLGIGSLGAYMAATGQIRLKSKDYSGERALDTGADFNAIKVGDEWVPIEKLSPIANLLFMGAEVANFQKHFEQDEEGKVADLAFNMAAAIATQMVPKYLTDSMADFLNGIAEFTEGKKKLSDVGSGVAKIAETAMPMRWLYKNIGDAQDPVRRDVSPDPDMGILDTMWQETKNRFLESAGYADGLPVQKNIWGKPINMPPGFALDTMSVFFGKGDEEMDFYDKELRRLGLDEPSFPGLLSPEEMALRIRMPDRTIQVGDVAGKMVTSKMTAKQYSDFIDFMNEPTASGKTMRGEVEKVIDSPISDEMKKYQIKEVIETFEGVARAKMMRQEYDIIEKLKNVGRDRVNLLKGIE